MKEHALAWLFTFAARHLVRRFHKSFHRSHGSKLPIVLVAGNVGKSTATLLLSDMMRKAGKHVITGTEQEKNLNTPMGLVATLLDKKILLSQGGSGLLRLFFDAFFAQVAQHDANTVLVYECGVDQQRGTDRYLHIFEEVDLVAMPIIALEHSQNFTTEVDQAALRQLLRITPHTYREQLAMITDGVLKNCILEQLKFATIARTVISPSIIGRASQDVLVWKKNEIARTVHVSVRTYGTQLVIAGITTPNRYILPATFGIFGSLLQAVVETFNIPKKFIKETLEDMRLPYSRFSKFVGTPPFSSIIDSSYNSDPVSLSGFLDLVEDHGVMATHHCIILGEMRELGKKSPAAHKAALLHIFGLSERIPLSLWLVGSEWLLPEIKEIWQDIEGVNHAIQVSELFPLLDEFRFPKKSWMWCKGSQNTIFLEEVVKRYLANPDDMQYLCRQGDNWMNKKSRYTNPTYIT